MCVQWYSLHKMVVIWFLMLARTLCVFERFLVPLSELVVKE